MSAGYGPDPRDGHDASDEAALSWGDERDPSLVSGRDVGEGTEATPDPIADAGRAAAGSALLIFYGAAAGVYLLFTIGWVLAALADSTPTVSVFAQLMHEFGLFCAIAAPALWALAVFILTKRPFSRVVGLVLGMLVLVPWPFVLGGWS